MNSNGKVLFDATSRPISSQPQNEFNPVLQVLYPAYFGIVNSLAGEYGGSMSPEWVADTAMAIAIAACAKIGMNFNDPTKKET